MTFLLLAPYLVVAIIVIWKVLKRVEGKRKKQGVFLLLMLAFYLPLGWDVILGRAYFYYLCETQGGVHVYRTVELGPEYWGMDGSPKFIRDEDGELDEKVLNGKYRIERGTGKINKYISTYTARLIDVDIREVIADRVVIDYLGGWFVRNAGFHSTAGPRCVQDNPGLYEGLLKYVLVKGNSD